VHIFSLESSRGRYAHAIEQCHTEEAAEEAVEEEDGDGDPAGAGAGAGVDTILITT
jgi:hypothetical protein